MNELENDAVLSAIRRGEDSLPKLRSATGLDYAKLHTVLHKLEFEWRSIQRNETADGFDRYVPTPSERSNGFKGTHWKDAQPQPISPKAFHSTRASAEAREAAILQREAPYCVSCHGVCVLHGTDRNGRIRWRCKPCEVTFAGSGEQHPMNRLEPEKRQQAISAFNEGKSVRKVAAEVGIATGTALKIREEEKIEALCPCGQDAKHQGWCSHRYQNSPARQETVRKMNMGHIDPEEAARQEARQKIDAMVERGRVRREELGPEEEAAIQAMREGVGRSSLGDEEEAVLDEMRGGELDEDEARIAAEIDAELTEEHNEETEVEPALCGCGRLASHRGRCAARRVPGQKSASREIGENITETITKPDVAKPEEIIPQIIPEAQPLPKTPASLMQPKSAMAQVQVMGGMRLHEDVEIRVSEMAQWPADRITEFFEALAKVIEIPNRALPTKMRPAWSTDFESNGPENTRGITMCYLVGMLHHNMEPHEKEAVWTLVQYLKRIEAYVEQKKARA